MSYGLDRSVHSQLGMMHEVDRPAFNGGRSFRVAHRFLLPDGTLAVEGEQVRIWPKINSRGKRSAANILNSLATASQKRPFRPNVVPRRFVFSFV